MKKFVKYISLGIACLLFITSFFFMPKNNITSASTLNYDNTYEYSADIVNGYYSGMGELGVKSFESINFNTYFLYHFRVDCTELASDYKILELSRENAGSYAQNYFNSFYINQVTGNNGVRNVNFNIYISAPDFNSVYYYVGRTSGLIEFYINSGSSASYVDFYISQANFIVNHSTRTFTLSSVPIDNYLSYSGLGESVSSSIEDLIDFDSDTNFELSFNYDSLNQNIFGSAYQLIKWTYLYWNSHTTGSGDYIIDLPKFTSNQTLYYLDNSVQLSDRTANFTGNIYGINYINFSDFDSSSILINDLTYYTESLDFDIMRPVLRVNNSLCIYNFDYISLLDNITTTSYSLSRGNDLYKIIYDGVLPNDKYITVGNAELNNILFDEYINLSFDYSKVPFKVSQVGLISYKLGFDFNFVYYTQPLITDKNSYSFEFDKPAYKDASIEFSIVPPKLNIPFLAWCENILIFIMFYCPIFSDLFELLHFDLFFGALIDIIDLYTSSLIGDFVLGCIGFIVFWHILKALVPITINSAKGWEESGSVNLADTIDFVKRNNKIRKNKQALKQDRVNRVSAVKYDKHAKSYFRSSTFREFKSKNNINRVNHARVKRLKH